MSLRYAIAGLYFVLLGAKLESVAVSLLLGGGALVFAVLWLPIFVKEG